MQDLNTKSVTIYRTGEKQPVWEHRVEKNEYVRVGYQTWGVVVDFAESEADWKLGKLKKRMIFQGCVSVESCES